LGSIPTFQAGSTISPTQPIESTSSVFPSEEALLSTKFNVSEYQTSDGIGISYFEVPEIFSTYILTVTYTGSTDDGMGSKYEIEYISVDGSIKGKLLEISDLYHSVDYAYLTHNIDKYLFLVNFDNSKISIIKIDLYSQVSRTLTIDPVNQTPESNRFMKLEENPEYGFSPDGDWFVWRCDVDSNQYWCLIDITNLTGWKIHRSVEDATTSIAQNLIWSPNSQWFMDYCPKRGDRDLITYCFVDPNDHTIDEWEFDSWPSSSFPYYFESDDISMQGENFLQITSKGKEETTIREIDVIHRDCIDSNDCKRSTIFSVSNPSRIDALWSSTQQLIAVDYNLYQSQTSNESGPVHIVAVKDNQNDPRLITDSTPPGAQVIALSPNNKWFVLRCGDRQDYEYCSASMDGEFFNLVPKSPTTFSDFLGWYVVE
jgi:hypothetical protein